MKKFIEPLMIVLAFQALAIESIATGFFLMKWLLPIHGF